MSRYEPPIPVKEKEKEESLEKVREMTNEGSKGSKSEKQAEGDTDLSWDHEGLEPHPEPSKPKPPRSPKPSRVPRPGAEDEQTPVKICPKCKGNHDEKDCPKFLYKEEREEVIPPQPVKQSLQTDKSEAKAEKNRILRRKAVSQIRSLKNGWRNKMNSLKKKRKNRKRGSL